MPDGGPYSSRLMRMHRHLALKQHVTLKNFTTTNRDMIERIPETVEQVLIKNLDSYGRCQYMLHQDVLDTSSQHTRMMQQVVRFLSIGTEIQSLKNYAD